MSKHNTEHATKMSYVQLMDMYDKMRKAGIRIWWLKDDSPVQYNTACFAWCRNRFGHRHYLYLSTK